MRVDVANTLLVNHSNLHVFVNLFILSRFRYNKLV